MALVLPILRLWLLLLNVYGTFKSMKPPPQSQRSARNGQGPSARAMQLRKRELKSCLAVWVVWAMFSTLEGPVDRTIGLVTPFYNELKCIVVLFLLAARSHGAEAIFLHIIHPLLRPYVPAIDDILANLHSVFDLFTLLFFLPFEYVSYRWYRWRNPAPTENGDDDGPPNDTGGGGEVLLEARRRLRPRNELQQARMRDADRQAQVVFQDIDEAQDRVRSRTRSQPPIRINGRGPPNRGDRVADRDPEPGAVGLRTRRRVLEYPPAEGVARGPGSRTTGVHHVYPAATDDLPQVPSSQPFPALPSAPTIQPVPIPSQPVAPVAQPLPSYHEIWHPRPSASPITLNEYDARRRTPSPIYPPLPSAYTFTPQRSDPLPPAPRMITPPDLVTPTPRRVSATNSRAGLAPFARPSRNARSAEPLLPPHKHERIPAEDFFGPALETSIQAVEMDMDTEILPTRDDSSANANGDDMEVQVAGDELRDGQRNGSEIRRGKRKAEGSMKPLRRSTRTRPRYDRSSSVETDEFGFTIRPDSSTLGSTTSTGDSASSSSSWVNTGSAAAGPSAKKPLARTKPVVKSEQRHGGRDETESSDEESVKKRRKLRPGAVTVAQEFDPELLDIEEDDTHLERGEGEGEGGEPSRQGNSTLMRGRGKRKRTPQRAKAAQPWTRPTRATRASTRQPVSATESQPQKTDIIKKRGRRDVTIGS